MGNTLSMMENLLQIQVENTGDFFLPKRACSTKHHCVFRLLIPKFFIVFLRVRSIFLAESLSVSSEFFTRHRRLWKVFGNGANNLKFKFFWEKMFSVCLDEFHPFIYSFRIFFSNILWMFHRISIILKYFWTFLQHGTMAS